MDARRLAYEGNWEEALEKLEGWHKACPAFPNGNSATYTSEKEIHVSWISEYTALENALNERDLARTIPTRKGQVFVGEMGSKDRHFEEKHFKYDFSNETWVMDS